MGKKSRITIRSKLFFVLLAFSLIPLIALTVLSQRGTRKLSNTIGNDTLTSLTEIMSTALELTANSSARILFQSKTALEYSLQVLADETEHALSDRPQSQPKIYMARQFDDPAEAPPDLVLSSAYQTRSESGKLEYQQISFNHPVFLIAPETSAEAAQNDIARLTPLTEAFKTLSTKFGDKLHWISVSLENGVHAAYPGHGGYPDGYDPRKSAWYTRASDAVVWTFPLVDPISGQVNFTASKRLYYPDGTFAGVAALDILITEVMGDKQLSSLWSSDMRSFMVAVGRMDETDDAGLMILAQKEEQKNVMAWSGPARREWLLDPGAPASKDIVNQIELTTSGYLELPYNGVASIWAYAYIERNSYFIIIVPKSVIMTLPNHQRQTIIKHTKEQMGFTAIAALLAIILLSAAALFWSKTITSPMRIVLSATRRLANGDYTVRINKTTRDELQEVFDAFNEMVPRIENNMRVQKALNLAMEVQQNLLPKTDPDIKGLDIAGTTIFCEEIGGDYYDYLSFEQDADDRTGIVVGDVSEHGIPSALLMATARSSLRQSASQPGTISEMVNDLNHQLAEDVEASGRFMTLFLLAIDLKNKSWEWVRAGHDPAILYDPGQDVFHELLGPGLALGVNEGFKYTANQKAGLSKGQIVVVGTDGIWEARNPDGDMFGKKPVLDLIRDNAGQDAKSILAAIIDALSTFLKSPDAEDGSGLSNAEDDITLAVVKITGQF